MFLFSLVRIIEDALNSSNEEVQCFSSFSYSIEKVYVFVVKYPLSPHILRKGILVRNKFRSIS